MPNHITHKLTVLGDRASEILAAIKGSEDDRPFIDFNKIVPMPEGMDLMFLPWDEDLTAKALFSSGQKPDPKQHNYMVHRLYKNLQDYGFTSFYDWSIANWGTKWNAYSQEEIDERTIQFDTAWSVCWPVLDKLSRRYPDTVFSLVFADEDIGYQCGHVLIKDGKIKQLHAFEDGSDTAVKFACGVLGHDYEELRKEQAEHDADP